MYLYDISLQDPSEYLSKTNLLGDIATHQRIGNMVYLGVGYSCMEVDISDPAEPIITGSLELSQYIVDIHIHGDLLQILTEQGWIHYQLDGRQ